MVLGLDDIGVLAPGYAADFIAIDLNRVEFAGALHDPVAAAVMTAPFAIDHSWVGGRPLVRDGEVVDVDTGRASPQHFGKGSGRVVCPP